MARSRHLLLLDRIDARYPSHRLLIQRNRRRCIGFVSQLHAQFLLDFPQPAREPVDFCRCQRLHRVRAALFR